MGKIHTLTAIAAFLFIVVMLFIISEPFDFADKDVEEMYHASEGLIWFLGIGIGSFITMLTFITGTFQQDLKHCSKISNEKSEQIRNQNKSILKNQLDYIDRIDILTKSINENRRDDTELLRNIHEQNENIRNQGKNVSEVFNKIGSIEKLLKAHDGEIRELKKIVSKGKISLT